MFIQVTVVRELLLFIIKEIIRAVSGHYDNLYTISL